MRKKVTVCIIGAGEAGLGCAKHIIHGPNENNYDVAIYEQQHDIGGVWLYTDKTGADAVHSSVYKNMM